MILLLLFIPILFIMVRFGLMLFDASREILSTTRRLKREGQITIGTLKELRSETKHVGVNKTLVQNHYARVDYQVDGKEYTRGIPISPKSYRAWTEGREMRIRYLPNDPQTSVLPNESTPTAMGIAFLVMALTLLGSAVGIAVALIAQFF